MVDIDNSLGDLLVVECRMNFLGRIVSASRSRRQCIEEYHCRVMLEDHDMILF